MNILREILVIIFFGIAALMSETWYEFMIALGLLWISPIGKKSYE